MYKGLTASAGNSLHKMHEGKERLKRLWLGSQHEAAHIYPLLHATADVFSVWEVIVAHIHQ